VVKSKTPNEKLHLPHRDLAVLRGLFESRVMTSAHVAALYFGDSREAAKKRLQKIKTTGLIAERKRRVNEPAVLFLTRKGFSLLADEGQLEEFPKLSISAFEKRADVSALTIRHELEVMDVKAAFYSTVRNSETFTIAEFSTWPMLHQFRAVRPNTETDVLVKPDGFIRIHEKEKDGGVSEHTFFLEVDRSTETQTTLLNRAGCYLDYYKSGGFAVQNRASRSAYKEFPFRVLFVMKSEQRRDNTAARLLAGNPPIRTIVYLSTLTEVLAEPVGKIWIQPSNQKTKAALL
jgi:Replication-relaxation